MLRSSIKGSWDHYVLKEFIFPQGLEEVESREGSICVVHTGGDGVGHLFLPIKECICLTVHFFFLKLTISWPVYKSLNILFISVGALEFPRSEIFPQKPHFSFEMTQIYKKYCVSIFHFCSLKTIDLFLWIFERQKIVWIAWNLFSPRNQWLFCFFESLKERK